ncbi:MAG: sigma-70 family RNA polymerase sigma factor [Pseudomonadota bacterium]
MINSQTDQWQEWAISAQKGDKVAYTKLLKEISAYTKNVVSKRISNNEAAEDIAQEVLISVHKSLNTYSADRPFKPWLSAIINFRRSDYLRAYYNKRQDKMTTTVDNPEFIKENVTELSNAGELKDIEAALETLPEKQRQIFEMIKIEGYTAQEVANEMQMKESAVKVSAHRTMKKLQGILK